MHRSSRDNMRAFRTKYLEARTNEPLYILDLGSLDVNGSYRDLFAVPPWRYCGVDLAAGQNVDLVLRDPYCWREIPSNSVDVLISGQAFEHIEFFWLTMLEIGRVLKPEGICCLIAPSSGFEHRHPVDCWRFYPDGFAALARFASLTVAEVYRRQGTTAPEDEADLWRDTVLVCRKPAASKWASWKRSFRHYLLRRI